MKKLAILFAFMLIPNLCFAQVPRNASGVTVSGNAGLTNVAQLGVTGLDVTGNPGYIILSGAVTQPGNYVSQYYLWVDRTGDLCMASHPEITNDSNAPNGTWANVVCTKVGGQS